MKNVFYVVMVSLIASVFVGCASIPTSHTYSQGISDYPYNDELIVSRFEGKHNTKSMCAEYAFVHCFEVCNELGYGFTKVSGPVYSKQTRVNQWAETMDFMFYEDEVVEYLFSCTDDSSRGAMESGLMATKARLMRVKAEEEQKRRDEMYINNRIVGAIAAFVIVFSAVTIGMVATD